MSDKCTCGHDHSKSHLRANAETRKDPTKTRTIVKKFEADLVRRFKAVRRDIVTAIVDHDVFGIQPNKTVIVTRSDLATNLAPPPRAFAFGSNPEKINAFMNWLRQQEDNQILEVTSGTPVRSAANNAWTNTYIRSAYDKGTRNAGTNIRQQGGKISDRYIAASFTRPIHADAAGIVFTRAFTDLHQITEVMDSQISRVLSNGIISGKGAKQLAKDITNRVDKIGITRARVLARTEVIAAQAEATLNLYAEAGIEGVEVLAEFSTAGDDDVCPICEALEGKIYKIEDSHGVIPVHPNCRCTFLPIIPDAEAIDIQ